MLEALVADLVDAARVVALHNAIAVLIYPAFPVLVGCKRLLKLLQVTLINALVFVLQVAVKLLKLFILVVFIVVRCFRSSSSCALATLRRRSDCVFILRLSYLGFEGRGL